MDLEISSCSTSEITESTEFHSNSNPKTLNSTEINDLNQLLKAIDARISSRQAGPNPLTRSQSPKLSSSETVNIKQALRRLCISQASEQAAAKRVGKNPNGSVPVRNGSVPVPIEPVPGTIRRLYASLVVRADESDERTSLVAQEKDCDKKGKNVSTSCIGCIKNKIEPDPSFDSTASSSITTQADPLCKSDSDPEISKPDSHHETLKSEPKKSDSDQETLKSEHKKSDSDQETLKPEPSSKSDSDRETLKPEPSSKSDSDHETLKSEPSSKSGSENETLKSEPVRPHQQGETEINSSKSSIGEYYSSSSISNESSTGTGTGTGTRPHMSHDSNWAAIRTGSQTLTLDSFKLIKRLGCGDIGTVYLAELTGTDCLFALKVMDVEYLETRKKTVRAETEREILEILDHPFLPSLYASFTTDNLSCLVMEFCPGGDLHVLRQKQPNRCFSEPAARFYVAEVLLALEYLHMLGIIYRDLKPENILVRSDGHIMLSDFDLSMRCHVSPTLLNPKSPNPKFSNPKFLNPNPCPDPFCLPPTSCFANPNSGRKPKKLRINSAIQLVCEPNEARSNSFVGTHEYLAPEIIKGDGHGSAVDWWTLGVFLYELLYGKTPFKGADNDETLGNVVCNDLKFPDEISTSFYAKDLIRRLLIKEPERRLGFVRGAAELKKHPFFEGLNWALVRSLNPPETDGSFYMGTNLGTRKKKESTTCLNFIGREEETEFGVF